MFRLLLLLIVIGAAGYFTNPTQEAHQAQARAAIEAKVDSAGEAGDLIEQGKAWLRGAIAGNDGKYETFYVASKYTQDLPLSAYVECYGAFTMVKCTVYDPG